MSQTRINKSRPLGTLRVSTSGKNTSDKFFSMPRLVPDVNQNVDFIDGIHGNAMQVPPPQEPAERRNSEDRPKSDKSLKAQKSASESHANCEKEIKNGLNREKDLKNQISLIEKQLSELKVALRGKDDEIKNLEKSIKEQETQFGKDLSKEKSSHIRTKEALDKAIIELDKKQNEIQSMKTQNEEELKKQKIELEAQHQLAIAEKDKTIEDREQRLTRLKSQMAEALKGNSWERQQQLEELTKELSRLQEESDALRLKIKSLSKNKQSKCLNCEDSANKVSKLQSCVKERDEKVKQLTSLCGKYETQLMKQDKLLEQWAISKGHKISAPK